jgi:hypothetical protein
MSNRAKANQEEKDDIENIFSELLEETENNIKGLDLSVLNLTPNEINDIKRQGHYDLDEEFQKLENDNEAKKYPEILNNLKQVKILIDALNQFIKDK